MSLHLGLDLGTQGLKGQIIDIASGKIVFTESISFGKDLPEFKSPSGYLINSNPLIVHSDPLMWAAGLDLLFSRMKHKEIPLDSIQAISGSAQQHGSVYLNSSFESTLKTLDQQQSLASQISKTLSRETAPIWMDRSTHKECVELIDKFKDKIHSETGSPPIERFTGPQIRKFYKSNTKEYEQTQYIHLVSSFLASLICGKSTPLDYSDASGTNMFSLNTFTWNKEITDFVAPELLKKLPALVPSATIIGVVSPYYAKYGFSPKTQVVAFAGDNPSSLIGAGAGSSGIGVISLGTSDTFSYAIENASIDFNEYGHILGNPAGGLMRLLCFTNGSLAREKILNECNLSWSGATKLIEGKTKAGNEGNFLLPYFVPESVPLVLNPKPVYIGSDKYTKGEEKAEVKLRGILESQAIRMKLHVGKVDLKRIRVAGGASENKVLCQILADVFGTDLEKILVVEAAALGAALRAASVVGKVPLVELCEKFVVPIETIKPNKENYKVYEEMLSKYAKAEAEYKDI